MHKICGRRKLSHSCVYLRSREGAGRFVDHAEYDLGIIRVGKYCNAIIKEMRHWWVSLIVKRIGQDGRRYVGNKVAVCGDLFVRVCNLMGKLVSSHTRRVQGVMRWRKAELTRNMRRE